MHVTIEAECRRGLRIINDIPDIGLCKLEGYNGIGKTSAIRLLQLCTGETPFGENHIAWRTFCAELISAKVRIAGLAAASEISLLFRPNDWSAAERERSTPLTSDMADVRIDGRVASINDVQALLRIYHINVTETPLNILIKRVEAGGAVLSAWHSNIGRPRAESMDDRIYPIIKALQACPGDKVTLTQRVANDAVAQAAEIAGSVTEERERLRLLNEAVEIADQLATVQGASPQLDARIVKLEERLHGIDKRKAQLSKDIEAARKNKDVNERAERKYKRAQSSLKRCANAQQKAANAVKQAAAEVGIQPDRETVQQVRTATERKLRSLLEAQPYVSTAPMIMALLNQLLLPLDAAAITELGASTLLEADDRQPGWTVAGLRDACRRQLVALAERDHGETAEQLAADIQTARSKLDDLASLDVLLNHADSAEEKLRKAEASLVQAATELPSDSPDRFDNLIQERNECEQQGRELQSAIDRLRSERDLLGGGKTEDVLAAELEELCDQVAVDPTRIRGALEQARAISSELSKREAEAAIKATAAKSEADECLAAFARLVTDLATDRNLAWLRRSVPQLTNLPNLELNDQIANLEALGRRLERARNALYDTTDTIAGISGAFENLAGRLRSPEIRGTDQPWAGPAAQWLADEVRRWFDDEIMRKALFDGGQDIRLDPRDLTVSWSVNGEISQRPLSFFSSGEQAFAHTRAQLAQLERDAAPVPNRLIALDEFSALLDGQRLAELGSYLAKRRDRLPQDQVLVILPTDVVAPMAKPAKGGSIRSAALAEQGYYAEAL